MIAASEPLEFIPRGRQAVEEHPGPLFTKQPSSVPNEQVLLNRMQNVNISEELDLDEFWTINEIYVETDAKVKEPKCVHAPELMNNFYVNSEEELYVRGCTAVWSQGLPYDEIIPHTCFTCETNIKHAFFCHESFYKITNGSEKSDESSESNEKPVKAICLIDSECLRVYCNNGEDYLSNLNFPVSNVLSTKYGILLEKEAASARVQSQKIALPRVFSLVHPLDEARPVLLKTLTGSTQNITEGDVKIVFSTPETDLVLMYDNKIGKHFVAKLRKATKEETISIAGLTEDNNSAINFSHIVSMHMKSCNTTRYSDLLKHNTSIASRSSLSTTNSPYFGKLQSSRNLSNSTQGMNRSHAQSPLVKLQSSLGIHSASVQDIRKIDQKQPVKPITPEFLLEHVWTENVSGKDFCESAQKAFLHTDFIEQTFLCYLLSRSCKLNLVRLKKGNTHDKNVFDSSSVIEAKDAVVLNRMKMIAVLDSFGALVLYTGNLIIAKVHVSGSLPLAVSAPSIISNVSPFPRRSSLLPSVQHNADINFEEELHLLSPVRPLGTSNMQKTFMPCSALRDAAGNRLTLVYPGGRMYRITLPLLNETYFISKCINALHQILDKDISVQFIARWYSTRNAPGSQDLSIELEWNIFRNLLMEFMGRSVSSKESTSTSEEPKKRKRSENYVGTDNDWEYLQNTLLADKRKRKEINNTSILHNDCNAPLFRYIPSVFYTFHLLYEDLKLDPSMAHILKYLAEFLYHLAVDMQLQTYCFHYFLDFPNLISIQTQNYFTIDDAKLMVNTDILQSPVPSLYSLIYNITQGKESTKYPFVKNVNENTVNIIKLISLICHGPTKTECWIHEVNIFGVQPIEKQKQKVTFSSNDTNCEHVLKLLLAKNITKNDVDRLPLCIRFLIGHSLEHSRMSPPTGCPPNAYELLLRPDLVRHATYPKKNHQCSQTTKLNFNQEDSLSPRIPVSTDILPKTESNHSEEDGMENVDTKLLRLRFPHDLRIMEVRKILNSSEPILIDIEQSPGVSDHDFIEEQEKQLFALCTRTMAHPMGRGMFTLRTSTPAPTESMPIPKLSLIGKEPVKGATIEMQQIEFPPNMSLWPSFHNGVAAGLRIPLNAKDINSTWIVYNRPKGQSDISTEHAGFLMALGLNRHLKALSFMNVYEYLVKCDEMTSIGLLLGISATHRGTMHTTVTKLLSVHIEALLPATALELDIPQNTQVAALMGVGLLYQGTAKRHIAEVLLQEIGRPPGPEMENSVERESYALTTGLALGLVTLGQGESPAGLRDLHLPDTLHYYMVGGTKRPLTGSQKEKYKLPSFQVREGDTVNIDVTAPGATLALGLMFFKTNNVAVAHWMRPPDTSYLLDLIRPDLLLLRIIARGLILWDSTEPTFDWLFGQFPESLKFDLKRGPPDDGQDIDHEATCQAFCNIIAGAAFCIGLRFAGTENKSAFQALYKTIQLFLSMSGQYVGEYAGKATVETSIVLILLSLSLVYAGSGNLEILRLIRYLRSRIGPSNPQVTYGSHLGIHMALGFLFLGCGRYTLSRSPESIAALVCSLFPKFPNHSNDNRYHLQAFRHLYVLAVEPRLFLARDIDSGKLCLCQIGYIKLNSKEIKHLPMSPCMLPELNTLQSVVVDDPNYWPICFERGRNWDQLIHILENCDCVDIKQRAGCLSHLDDPNRLKSLLCQTLTTEQYSCWKIDTKSLLAFSTDPRTISFTEKMLNLTELLEHSQSAELEKSQLLTIVFYKCLTKDKMHALPIYMGLLESLENLMKSPKSTDIWQFKIINKFLKHNKVSKEIVDSLCFRQSMILDSWRKNCQHMLKDFVTSQNMNIFREIPYNMLVKIAILATYYNLTPHILGNLNISGLNQLNLLIELKKLNYDVETINTLTKIFNVQ